MNPLIILAGPTATGKSETAVELAEELGTEIISVDSMQVFQQFDIGTAKPSKVLQARVKHHLIDCLPPQENFTAFEFKQRADRIIRDLHARDKVPILVGGTGLYIQVLMQDFDCAIAVDPELRERILNDIKTQGSEAVHAELAAVDPESASRIQPQDPIRIERALGVFRQTGIPLSKFHREDTQSSETYKTQLFVLEMERARLYDLINKRVDRMMDAGWLDEVRSLLSRGMPETCKPFQGIGYKQLLSHLKGEMTLDEAVLKIKQETRRYAKRQVTWFKKQAGAQKITVETNDTPTQLKNKVLSFLSKGVAALCLTALLGSVPSQAVPAQSESFKSKANPIQAIGRLMDQGKFEKACQLLSKIESGDDRTKPEGLAIFLKGKCLLHQKKFEQAVKTFQRSLGALPQLEDYIRLDLARANLGNKNPKAGFEEVSYLLQQFPQTRLGPEAERIRAEALHALKQTEQAVFFLQEAMERWSENRAEPDFAPAIPGLMLLQAQYQESLNWFSRAYLSYRKIFTMFPANEVAGQAQRSMDQLTKTFALFPPVLMENEMNRRMKRLLKSAMHKEALEELTAFGKRSGNKALPPQWYFDLSSAYNGLRERPKVVETLKKFMKAYPGHPRQQQARFTIGKALWNIGKNSDARDFFSRILKSTSKTKWKITAGYYLARVLEDDKKIEEAKKHYQAILKNKGRSSFLEKAAWRLAWINFKTAKHSAGIKQLKENLKRWPDSHWAPKNLFWLAKLYEFTEHKAEAFKSYADLLDRFPFTYYGIQAEQKLALLEKEISPEHLPKVVKVGFNPPTDAPQGLSRSLTKKEKFHYVRATTLADLGFFNRARLEAKKASASIRKNLSGVLWTSKLFIKTHAYPEALRVLYMYRDYKRPKGEKELPVSFWKGFFPLAYFDLIEKPASRHAIDPFFVDGLIRQESMFNADIVSPAGARGLMQIMPETGQRLFSPGNGYSTFDKEALFDPEFNVRLGVKYLGQLTRRFGSKEAYLLISYNAGPHVLDKWLKRFKDIKDEDVFIESIPYPETRGYVKRVMRNYGIYRRIYKNAVALPEGKKTF